MAAICSEYRDVRIDAERIIPPMTSGDHPAVKIEDAGKLPAIKGGNWAPVPSTRERRDYAQALFTFDWE